MRRVLSAVVAVCIVVSGMFVMTSCSIGGTGKKVIGIVQIVEHPSLNTIRESIIAELKKNSYEDGVNITVDYQNAQGDQANLKTICQKFANKKYDLIIAIATPSAVAAAGETKTIPIVFAACTDPVGSKLVANMEKPGKNITGTSDAVSAQQIMELAKRITPDIKTIGALYNSGETNSVSVINDLKTYAKNNGMKVVEATVTNSSEVQQATQSLAGKADAIFSPIDNTVASAMSIVAKVTKEAKIPVYVGADSMVKDGALATCGVNYTELGKETGDMVVQILKGTKPGDIAVKTIDKMAIYLNKTTAKNIGITFPSDVLSEAAEVFK